MRPGREKCEPNEIRFAGNGRKAEKTARAMLGAAVPGINDGLADFATRMEHYSRTMAMAE